MAEGTRTVLVRIGGRVQGVGFRDWTRRRALALGLSGWVRNEPDGAVRALVSGPPAGVAAMLEEFRRGPGPALVASVEIAEAGAGPVPAGFEVRR